MARWHALSSLGLVAQTLLACASAPPSGAVPAPAAATREIEIEKTAIDRSAGRSLTTLRACYRNQLALDPGLERRLTFYVYVTPSGHIENPVLTDGIEIAANGKPVSALPRLNGDVTGCISHELRAWELPPTSWHGEVHSTMRPLVVARFEPAPECPAPQGRSRAELWPIMMRSMDGAKACFSSYNARAAPRTETVTINTRILVDDRGRITDVSLRERNLLDEVFDACLLSELRKLDFSSAPERPIDFCFPFTFVGQR